MHASRRSVPAPATPPPVAVRLLCVAGLSPQVITETLYCLLVQHDPPIAPREIHVLTTQEGRRRIQRDLLAPRRGWFHRFCADYGVAPGHIRFDASCLHVPAGPDGTPLEDVRTPEDNTRVADAVLALVRELTRDPAVALHASVAGGRKTMGLFLGIAFQLFARPQDRLSHVLVTPSALEGNPDFYYPSPRPTTLTMRGKRMRSQDVRVDLAEIPMLLLRDRVQTGNLGQASYRELIAQHQAEVDRLVAPPPLELDVGRRLVQVEDRIIRLTPVEFAVYHLLAGRRAHGCGGATCGGCARCAVHAYDFLAGPVLDALRASLRAPGVRDDRARTLAGWGQDGDARFLQLRNRIARKLREALGRGRWAEPYLIGVSRPSGEASWYMLSVGPSQIVWR